jgi:hypothetical protein
MLHRDGNPITRRLSIELRVLAEDTPAISEGFASVFQAQPLFRSIHTVRPPSPFHLRTKSPNLYYCDRLEPRATCCEVLRQPLDQVAHRPDGSPSRRER